MHFIRAWNAHCGGARRKSPTSATRGASSSPGPSWTTPRSCALQSAWTGIWMRWRWCRRLGPRVRNSRQLWAVGCPMGASNRRELTSWEKDCHQFRSCYFHQRSLPIPIQRRHRCGLPSASVRHESRRSSLLCARGRPLLACRIARTHTVDHAHRSRQQPNTLRTNLRR